MIADSLTPNVIALVVASAVFTDTVLVCGMKIGALQFVLCVILLAGAMMIMGVISIYRWKEMELLILIKVVIFDMWKIMLSPSPSSIYYYDHITSPSTNVVVDSAT